jgi:hypothetical protein
VGDHEIPGCIPDVDEPIADTGRLDVVAPDECVIHAATYLRLQLGDEGFVHRADHGQQNRRLRVRTVEAVAGSHEADVDLGGQLADPQRLDRNPVTATAA